MENKESSLFVFAGKYGVLGAIVAIVITLLFFVLDMQDSAWLNIVYAVLLVIIILWGQYEYGKTQTASAGYGRMVGLGVLIVLYYAIVAGVYGFIHLGYIDTEAMSRGLAAAEEAMLMQGLPDEQIRIALKYQSMFMSPIAASLTGAVSSMVIGTIISLITSIMMKKNQ